MRAIPQSAIAFLKFHEGYVGRAYDDQQPNVPILPGDTVLGKLTAGYGHTGPNVVPGMAVTPALAETWLQNDCEAAASRLANVLTPVEISGLTDNQWAAIICFAFNLGVNPTWTLWQVINAGELSAVPAEMNRFVFTKIAGKPVKMPGLVARRAAEVRLWSKP